MGFHGDKYLIEVAFASAKRCGQFIETDTNVGSTLHYFARHFPATPCFSCEPDPDAFNFARKKSAELKNAQVFQQTSPGFLHNLDKSVLNRDTLFWVDSHGYGFKWPLREEVAFITNSFRRGCIFIDDFKVPGQPQFSFDEYDGQICAFEEIKSSLRPCLRFQIVYPSYSEKTSTFHPLRGWIRMDFGFDPPLEIPTALAGKVTVSEWPLTNR